MTYAERLQYLLESAQAVLERWNSPRWEWGEQGPTADLMHDLQRAINSIQSGKEIK